MSLTPREVQVLQLLAVATEPMLRAEVEAATGAPARSPLHTLRTEGHLSSEIKQVRGQHTLAHYSITPAGRSALARHGRTATHAGAPAAHRSAPPSGTYDGAELGQTCQRPGAYDAFRHPSLIGGQLVWPKGFAA